MDFPHSERERLIKSHEEDILRRNKSDIKKILSLPEGRRIVWRILGKSKMFHSCFTGNSTTFYNEGARDLGLSITEWIMEADPQLYYLMMQENYREEKEFEEKLKQGEENARTN